MTSRIVISDTHGCAKTFEALLDKLPKDVPVVVTGDYVDRGPRSNEVIQLMIDRNIEGTLGNHEQMMMDFFDCFPQALEAKPFEIKINDEIFLANGGLQTLISYGYNFKQANYKYAMVTPPEDLTQIKAHLEWIKALPVYREYKDCANDEGRHLVVSHSSITEYYHVKDDPDMIPNIIWNRKVIQGGIKDKHNIYNCFGHTVVDEAKIKKHYACLDRGAVFKDEPKYGVLVALQYPEMTLYEQHNLD